MHIVNEIAKYCSKLAAITSLTFESATSRGVLKPFLIAFAKPLHLLWKLRLLSLFPFAKFATYIFN
jgi:hypothetical protein